MHKQSYGLEADLLNIKLKKGSTPLTLIDLRPQCDRVGSVSTADYASFESSGQVLSNPQPSNILPLKVAARDATGSVECYEAAVVSGHTLSQGHWVVRPNK